MKLYIKKEENVVQNVLVEIECDLCHKRVNQTKLNCDYWAETPYDIKETVVKISEGKSYREDGGFTEEKWVDICPKCFNEKLIPWLIDQGATIQEKMIDW